MKAGKLKGRKKEVDLTFLYIRNSLMWKYFVLLLFFLLICNLRVCDNIVRMDRLKIVVFDLGM